MTVEEMIKAEARYAVKNAKKEGLREGRKEGIKEGRKEGVDAITRLFSFLLNDERYDDIKRASTDEDFQKQLLNEYNIAFLDFEDVND